MSVFPFFKGRRPPQSDEILTPASAGYRESVRLWLDMYRGRAPWLADGGQSLNLPSTIAGELARISTIEADIRVEGDNSAFVSGAFDSLLRSLRRYAELACAGGSVVFKPESADGGITISCLAADRVIPLAFSPDGELTSVSLIYYAAEEGKLYCRVETHTVTDEGCVVTNSARSCPFALPSGGVNENVYCGEPVALDTVPAWKDIPERAVDVKACRLKLALFTMPQCCFFDIASPVGASVYSRACELIREADYQFRRLLWEFEGGELAVDVSEDLFRRTKSGLALPVGKERLFRPNLADAATSDSAMRTFSPALRDSSLINGLDVILARVEDVCGLSRGTLSSLNYTSRTATEIKDSKQRLYTTVCDIQKSLTSALKRLALAVVDLGVSEGLCGEGTPEIVAHFNDSIVEDASDERAGDLEEVKAEVMTREEFRRKWGLD